MTEGHQEFLSEGWVANARAVLERRVAAARDALAGVRFCFCEAFSDAPEHLRTGPQGEAGWWFRLADGELEVGRGFIDADVLVSGDYATVLPIARLVVDGDPDREREMAELAKRGVAAGKLRRELRRGVTGLPDAIGDFHDDLARRTR